MRTENATRERLWRLLQRLPAGSKAPFARVCGYANRHRLRAVARYGAWLTPVVADRLNRLIQAVESGDLVIVDTGKRWGRYPRLRWQWSDRPVSEMSERPGS